MDASDQIVQANREQCIPSVVLKRNQSIEWGTFSIGPEKNCFVLCCSSRQVIIGTCAEAHSLWFGKCMTTWISRLASVGVVIISGWGPRNLFKTLIIGNAWYDWMLLVLLLLFSWPFNWCCVEATEIKSRCCNWSELIFRVNFSMWDNKILCSLF